jgi:hypothetical protein
VRTFRVKISAWGTRKNRTVRCIGWVLINAVDTEVASIAAVSYAEGNLPMSDIRWRGIEWLEAISDPLPQIQWEKPKLMKSRIA